MFTLNPIFYLANCKLDHFEICRGRETNLNYPKIIHETLTFPWHPIEQMYDRINSRTGVRIISTRSFSINDRVQIEWSFGV